MIALRRTMCEWNLPRPSSFAEDFFENIPKQVLESSTEISSSSSSSSCILHSIHFCCDVGHPSCASTFGRSARLGVWFSIFCDSCKPVIIHPDSDPSCGILNLADVADVLRVLSRRALPVMHLKIFISVVLFVGVGCFRSCFDGIGIIRGLYVSLSRSLSSCTFFGLHRADSQTSCLLWSFVPAAHPRQIIFSSTKLVFASVEALLAIARQNDSRNP